MLTWKVASGLTNFRNCKFVSAILYFKLTFQHMISQFLINLEETKFLINFKRSYSQCFNLKFINDTNL